MENITLEKVEFKNGSAGGTPLNATNLNNMQKNTEDAINKLVPVITALQEDSGTGGITSTTITSIQVVDTLPETEETGVLYLVKESTTPAVINLYPTQQSISNTENGCTVSFTDKQVSINGTPTSSMWGWTHHFTMPLGSGKTHALKLTNVSGNFDNSGRTSDDAVIKVLLYGYLADNTEVVLVNKEFTDTTIYNSEEFLCGDDYTEYYFSVSAKGSVAFDNLVLDISITEV